MIQKSNSKTFTVKVWLTVVVLVITGFAEMQAQADTTIWNFFNRSRLKIYSGDGDLRRIIWMKNGEQHGKSIRKYEGRVTSKIHYKNGKISGKTISYHRDGSVSNKDYFTDGLQSGVQRRYYSNGQLEFEIGHTIVEENGERKSVLHGPYNKYRPNGDPIYTGEYSHGKAHGRWESYSTTGELRDVSTFKEGKQHGPFEKYRDDFTLYKRGILYEEIEIDGYTKKKVYDGIIESFYPNGQLQQKVEYNMGKIDGFREFYHDNGRLRSKQEFISGEPTGPLIEYDENGQKYSEKNFEILEVNGRTKGVEHGWQRRWNDTVLVSEGMMQYGKAEGLWRNWYNDGTLKSEANLTKGLHIGKKTNYYPDGTIESIQNYRIGQYEFGTKSFMIGWQLNFEPDGKLSTAKYYDSTQTIVVNKEFQNNLLKKVNYEGLLNISYSPKGTLLNYDVIGHYGYPIFSPYYFTDGNLSHVQFYIPNSQNKQFIDYSSSGNITARYARNQGQGEPIHSESYALDLTESLVRRHVPNPFFSDSIRQGNYTLLYGNGNIAAKMHFTDDVPDGEFLFYHPLTGDTLLYRYYKQGAPIGAFVEKWSGEYARIRGVKRKGDLPDDLEEFSFDGKPISKKIYDSSDGSVDKFSYHPNGQLERKANEKKGTTLTYSAEGQLLSRREPIASDSSKAIVEIFYPNTTVLKSRSFFDGDKRDSTWTRYYPSGQLLVKEDYNNNKRNGQYEEYAEEGTLVRKGNYIDGKKDGQWVEPNGNSVDTVFYKMGRREVLLPSASCGCVDTTVTSSSALTPSLDVLTDYGSVLRYLPSYITPVDSLNFDGLFHTNLSTGGNRSYQTADLKLRTYKKLSFKLFPDEQLQLTLNPCITKGYPSDIPISVQVNQETDEATGRIRPGRVALSFLKGPVVSADEDYPYFTAFHNTNELRLDESGKLEINSSSDTEACYTKAMIHDFMEIQVEEAQYSLFYDENNSAAYTAAESLELTESDYKRFHGLIATKSVIGFEVSTDETSFNLRGESNILLLGSALATGEISVPARPVNGDSAMEVTDIDGKQHTIEMDVLRREWAERGFSRLKMDFDEEGERLLISFYIE